MKTCKSTCKFDGLCKLTGGVSPRADFADFSYKNRLTGGVSREAILATTYNLQPLYIIRVGVSLVRLQVTYRVVSQKEIEMKNEGKTK